MGDVEGQRIGGPTVRLVGLGAAGVLGVDVERVELLALGVRDDSVVAGRLARHEHAHAERRVPAAPAVAGAHVLRALDEVA